MRARFAELGAGGALDAVELGVLEPGRVAAALRLRYFERFVDDVISGDAVLREFTASTQDAAVAAFAELDGRIATAARGIILAKLAARLPAGRMSENCPAASELGILRRECAKKSRHKPVRALLESLPTLFPALKPCLLMSPLSVAQYLPPGTKPFDVVVFDEASQITVWDAIGAMARGRQCVVVGDPKQLPPTTFFQRQADGEEDIAECDIAELESILDECIAAGVSQSYLRWHYRSRHESLIAFSNHNYYGDRLRTFPSADQSTAAMGVSFVHVADGVYDRCRTRTNRREAEAVVEAVVRRMLDPAFRSKSAGVVTFSQAQQNLIEDLVDAQRRLHPEIECFFDSGADEPFFVKNLENVQGDERDALFFSIGYGPDADGKVAMNFGPLNRVGGERRLNVAVTRAKEQVVVFSSLLPEQVDLGRTQAVGAKHLKAFLEFAQGSGAASELRPCGAVAQGDSAELVDEIAQTLRMRGYAVDVRIGYSGLKIDIGVRADAESAKYVLGIECDGGAYRDGASVRDRDFLRRSVLEGLGWRMTRVWSAAWWHDREATERMLLTEVEAAVRGEPSPRACAARPAVSPAAPSRRAGRTRDARAAAAGEAFEKFEVPSVPGRGSRRPDDFCLPKAATKVRPYLEQLIARAAPLTGGYLRKRVRADWGIQRGGSAFEEVLAAAMPPGVRRTEQFGEAVYWRQEDDPAAFDRFRVPDGDSRRAIDEIPVEELAAAMRYLRRTFGELPEDSLFSETARLFGLPRVTPAARPRYAEAARRL